MRPLRASAVAVYLAPPCRKLGAADDEAWRRRGEVRWGSPPGPRSAMLAQHVEDLGGDLAEGTAVGAHLAVGERVDRRPVGLQGADGEEWVVGLEQRPALAGARQPRGDLLGARLQAHDEVPAE